MTAAWFLETRKPRWNRLESLVKKADIRGPAALSDDELHELTRLYPAITVDVARSRTYLLDQATQRHINQLAIAAHGLLYRRRHVRTAGALWRFFAQDYPRLFRRLWPYMTIATSLFVIGVLGAYVTVRIDPPAAYVLVPGGLDKPGASERVTSEDVSDRFRHSAKPPMASGIMGNNISVAFNAFALGITAGLGTCYVILFNAMMLGAFFAHFDNHHLTYECWSFIAGHGILEILAILIAAAAGLRLGLAMAVPGPLKRVASLRTGAREAVLLVLGTIPMFIVAGSIEAFVTPTYLPGALKIALGLAAGAAAMIYLLTTGREGGNRSALRGKTP